MAAAGGKKKEFLSVAFTGDINSGKSTAVGRLLAECDAVDKRAIEKNEKEGELLGKPSFKYAWVTDTLNIERSTGLSVVSSVRKLPTDAFEVQLVDTPGHVDYTQNAITGMAQADVQVLVVSAAPGELEAGLGPGGQTKDRAVLAHTLGAKRVIVAVTKMDATEPPFSQKRFEQAKKEVAAALKSGGIDPKTVAFLPISGLKGDNVYTAAGRCTWWEGWSAEPKSGSISGMSLLNAINAMVTPKRSEGALRVPIDRVRELNGVGSVASGRVEAGVLKVGQTVQVAPGNLTAEVKSIERSNTRAQSATVGEIVGFCLDLPPGTLERGMVVGDAEADPPRECEGFSAQIIVRNSPGAIRVGSSLTLDCGTSHVAVEVALLETKLDRKGKVVENQPESLKTGESGVVALIPLAPLCVEEYGVYPSLGRFTLRDQARVVAVGVIKAVRKLDKNQKMPKLAAALAALGN
eukprot:m.131619 g.131619  ORF g.131619 m.131619 type:complete len:464 (-) comp13765_c0_seq1:1971-3362(-)